MLLPGRRGRGPGERELEALGSRERPREAGSCSRGTLAGLPLQGCAVAALEVFAAVILPSRFVLTQLLVLIPRL